MAWGKMFERESPGKLVQWSKCLIASASFAVFAYWKSLPCDSRSNNPFPISYLDAVYNEFLLYHNWHIYSALSSIVLLLLAKGLRVPFIISHTCLILIHFLMFWWNNHPDVTQVEPQLHKNHGKLLKHCWTGLSSSDVNHVRICIQAEAKYMKEEYCTISLPPLLKYIWGPENTHNYTQYTHNYVWSKYNYTQLYMIETLHHQTWSNM